MSINLESLPIIRPERDVPIVDKNNEPTGLTFIVRPKTSDEYQKVLRRVQDRMTTPKKVPAKEKRDMNEGLFMAQIAGWKWEAPASETVGSPDFNPRNLKEVLYENGEYSAAIRMQLIEAIDAEEDFLDVE